MVSGGSCLTFSSTGERSRSFGYSIPLLSGFAVRDKGWELSTAGCIILYSEFTGIYMWAYQFTGRWATDPAFATATQNLNQRNMACMNLSIILPYRVRLPTFRPRGPSGELRLPYPV